HLAAYADSANIGTSTYSRHPSALGNIALYDRTPAADLDEAFWRAVFVGEITLLEIACAIAALMHGLLKQPFGTSRLIDGDHWREPSELAQQIEQRLHEVVGLNRAAGHVDDGQSRLGFPIPAEIVRHAHA